MQKIVVFQQNGSGEAKIAALSNRGRGLVEIAEVISIDGSLPPVLDEPDERLPRALEADLVLSFLAHPDLNHDLALLCEGQGVPLVASGKKLAVRSAITPPT